ncbi:MAG: ATP-grasp domain-containing protein [Spirochaetales bacterium]|nr:ATP-grasp domain-containing protein [Spirochaetales bacterium]
MKSVLILGGGVMQLPAIRIAKEMGWRIILADGNENVPGRELADFFEHVDLKDREGMVRAARKYFENGGLDGVFTAGTDFSATVAWVSESLGLPGIPYEVALKASSKGLMREAFALAGVPIPAFIELDRNESPARVLEKLSFPLVVKPVDNMGARGIRRIDNPDELDRAFKLAGEYSRSGKVIIEEFIVGPEFSLDALIEDGKVTICGIADRHIFFPPYFIEMGHTMPTCFDDSDVENICRVFKDGIKALGINRGAAKGDIKLSPDGPVVGEIAARLSGGFMSGWTFPYASGVEVTRGGLNLAVGLPHGDLTPRRRAYSAERAFISIPGIVDGIKGFVEAQATPGVEFSHLLAVEGKEVVFPVNNVEKCGNFISRAATREAAVVASETACRKIEILLSPGNGATSSFLRKHSYDWVPDAYAGIDMDVRKQIESMDLVSQGFIENGISDSGMGVAELPITPVKGIKAITLLDWHGLSVETALDRVRQSGGKIADEGEGEVGRIFWESFIRGGYQGGVWIIRTLASLLTPDERKEFIRQWIK